VPAPEKLTIDTPEQIALEFPLASAGSRFLALSIDSVLQAAAFALLVLAALLATYFRMTLSNAIGTWTMAVVLLGAFLLYYGYFAFFEAIWNGQTPGKRLIGIRAIAESGRPLGPADAILRNLLRIVDQIPGIYVVGLLSIFFTERNQRLGDLAAGTVVVHDRRVHRPDAPDQRRPSVRYGAARLTPEEIALAEAFLRRRAALDSYVRLTTGRQVLDRLRPKLDIPPDRTHDEERLLEEIVAEFRSR
jgi:uncharacterized RDD family membrane protein YckC